ncbi:MAG: exodeoxyribonuclease VII small subunit [SAR202 cluster bacterium Io17-Chloro-G4]|nr:MAG: exodeoxyribonuclease VII small subunit [SAR202 cluster bacterium Io17-Chloro-G4]
MAETSGSAPGSGPEPGPNPDLDSLTFEDAFTRLSEMASSLEDGGLTLADATARYEQGMSLVRRCNQLLEQAELKITTLKDSYNESLDAREEVVLGQPGQLGLGEEPDLDSSEE